MTPRQHCFSEGRTALPSTNRGMVHHHLVSLRSDPHKQVLDGSHLDCANADLRTVAIWSRLRSLAVILLGWSASSPAFFGQRRFNCDPLCINLGLVAFQESVQHIAKQLAVAPPFHRVIPSEDLRVVRPNFVLMKAETLWQTTSGHIWTATFVSLIKFHHFQ